MTTTSFADTRFSGQESGPLAQARGLRSFIEQEAGRTESARTMTADLVKAFSESGLFGLMVPTALGGSEADTRTSLEVFEELAYADGSIGWSLMANASTSCFASIYLDDEPTAVLFPSGVAGIHGGMFGPVGKATRDENGFLVDGSYRFGSGTAHADWFAAGFVEQENGVDAALESGMPAMRIAFIPAERITKRDGWNVLGLKGTGSFDYAVESVHVDEAFTFPLLEPVQHRGGATYQIGMFGLVAIGHAGFALGVGRRALDEVLEIAKTKQRLGGDPIAAQQMFLHEFAMHDAAMRAARAFTYEAFEQAEFTAIAEGAPTPVETQRMRQATTYGTRIASDACRFAYTWAGSDGLREPSIIGRCFRDISASTQHVYVDNNTLTAYTQTLMMFGEPSSF